MGFAPQTITSLTQAFTRSSPIPSYRPVMTANFSFVPTGSVLATSTGSSYPLSEYIAPNAPTPASASGPSVGAVMSRIRLFTSRDDSRSTPACL